MSENWINSMDNETQRLKALSVLEKVKELEKKKIGYKFVRINNITRVLRKI